MANPFTQERQDQIKDDAEELLKVFGIEYLKMYGLAMVERIRAELEGDAEEKRKLHYREWDSVERPELFSGWVYMKGGCGPGDFSKWKKVFIAEKQDYTIDLYASDKDYHKGKKPKKTINVCGYHLERDVSWFYRWEMKEFFSGIGMDESEIEANTSFSEYSWGLVHPWRTNYVFQLHKGKDPACPCLGGNVVEPEGTGSENKEERETYLEFFDRCVTKAKVRDLEALTGKAFEMTCEKLRSKMARLGWWQDDGKEGQMLTDALMIQCLLPLRDPMLADLKGPTSMKMVAWYKTRDLVFSTLEAMVNPAWDQVQIAAGKLGEKIEPVLKKGLEPIFNVKNKAKDKLAGLIEDKLAAPLAKNVTPYIDPIFKAFDSPMTKGYAAAKEVFDKEVVVSKIPDDEKQMRLYLDAIPRTSHNVEVAHQASVEVIEPLNLLKKLSEEIFGHVNAFELRGQAEANILLTLDAAVFKLENMIAEQGKAGAENFKKQIMAEYDYDVILARAAFMKMVIRNLLVGGFQRITREITSPVLDTLGDAIPEEMSDFLDLGAMLDEIIDIIVGTPIDKMVDAAYPPPN